MLWAAIFAATFFIIYASRTIFIGNTAFGGPDSIKIYYTIFLVFHINLATIGGVLGLIQILRPSKINLIFIEKLDLLLQLFGSLQLLLVWQYIYFYTSYIQAAKQHH